MTAAFVSRWTNSSASERANSQLFLSELCTLLGMPQPHPSVQDETLNTYVFEKNVVFNNGDGTTSPGRIDLYKQACFVLESKQGSEARAAQAEQKLATVSQQKKLKTGTAPRGTPAWDQAMVKARQQAKRYAEALPEWPHDLSDEDILQRLVDLNRERAEEERRGLIRWLRPEFQNPQGAAATQQELAIEDQETRKRPPSSPRRPKSTPGPPRSANKSARSAKPWPSWPPQPPPSTRPSASPAPQ
jgi:hypothetical protein